MSRLWKNDKMEVERAVSSINIVLLPEILRQKLGEDGAKEFVEILNANSRANKENVSEVIAERFERQLVEVKFDLEKSISETKAEMLKWMFVFWVGQLAAIFAMLKLVK